MIHHIGVLIFFVMSLVPALAGETERMMDIIHRRLEPARRDRVLQLWDRTRDNPAERAKLVAALERLDTKMKPDWTGLAIGGGTVAVASGIGVGALVAKLGAAGAVAGPVGIVAGVALGGLISYGIHKFHQKKAVEGGVFSRAGRKMGFAGRGLDGDLVRVERALPKVRPDDLNTDDLRNGGR